MMMTNFCPIYLTFYLIKYVCNSLIDPSQSTCIAKLVVVNLLLNLAINIILITKKK